MRKFRIPFDYFSLPARGFNIRGQESSRSWIGFLLTLGFFGGILAIFIAEVVSMFRRDSLTVSTDEEGLPSPPATSIKSVMMAFAVLDRLTASVSLTENVDFNIKASMATNTYTDTRRMVTDIQPLAIQRCDANYFGNRADEVKQKLNNVQDAFCISTNQDEDLLKLEGQLGSDVYKTINVAILCGAPGDTSCPATFVSSTIFFIYFASYMNVSNYENPITTTPTAIRDYADQVSYHEKTILITPRTVITDTGLAFSNEVSQDDLIVSEGSSLSEGINSLTPVVFNFYITLNPVSIKVRREYNKILDVLASTTGIASTVAFVVCFLLRPYLEEKAHTDVMKAVSPEKFKPITLRDYFKAIMGNKAAKQKLKITGEEKEWVNNNLDMIKMLKNWSDLEKVKKSVLIEGEMQDNATPDMNSFMMEKNKSFLNGSSMDISRVHPQ